MLEQIESQSITTFQKPDAINSLTGLRFIASMLVFLSHLISYTPNSTNLIKRFMFFGTNGVGLFFILSGFVLFYNYPATFKLKPFFVARFARIYPVYLLAFGIAYWLNFNAYPGRSIISQQLAMVQAWNMNKNIAYAYDAPAWSVSVEVFLYLCFPVIALIIMPKLKNLRPLLLLIVCCIIVSFTLATIFLIMGVEDYNQDGLANYVLYRLPLTRLCEFVAGCAMAKIFLLKFTLPKHVTNWLLYGSIAFTVSFMLIDIPILATYHYSAIYILPFLIIIFCLASQPTNFISRLLATKFLFYSVKQATVSTYSIFSS
jgi:peptidoglycan/LPS O-acetylase OafA/YrhL